MKTNGLLYRGGDKLHSSDKFLSKTELKQLFPDDRFVVCEITYVRKCFRIAERRRGKYVVKKNYPKTSKKSRTVLL